MAENESGFDTLKAFSQPESAFSFEPYQGYEQAGQVLRDEAKSAINTDLAVTAVEETPNYNKLANQFAGQYIPVRQASEEQAGIIAQQLGLGKRYSAEEMKAQIEKTLGPLPERNQKRRAVGFLVNSLRAKTPYKGAAGVLDVLLQAYSVDMTQEQALEIEQLKHKMAVGELAVTQAQDANEAVLAKEAQFYLKKMGQDDDYLQKYLSFNSDLSKKFAQFEIDKELNKIKGAQELINNPGRLDPNISYTVNGQTFTNVSRRVLNEDGSYQYKLIDEDGNFTRPVPINPETGFPDFFISPKQAPITEASLRDTGGTGISGSKQAELSGDLFALDRASQTLGDILNSQAEAIKDGGSYLGITGVINSLFQEAPLLFDDILSGISGGSQTWGEPADNSVYSMIEFEAPATSAYEKVLARGNTKTVTKNVNLAALLDTMTYTSLGYDKTYAQNKVRENIIIYALARAQKPTGRLNVDDVKRASDSVNISGLKSDEAVQAQLEEVLKFINRGIQSIYNQGYQQNTKGENYNIFDSNQAIDAVIKRMQKNLGIQESEITETEEPVEGEVQNTTVSDEDDDEEVLSISNEQIFSGGNI
jgi:hypothetical protein